VLTHAATRHRPPLDLQLLDEINSVKRIMPADAPPPNCVIVPLAAFEAKGCLYHVTPIEGPDAREVQGQLHDCLSGLSLSNSEYWKCAEKVATPVMLAAAQALKEFHLLVRGW